MGQRSVTVTGKGEYGYNIVGNEDGEASIIPFVDLVERTVALFFRIIANIGPFRAIRGRCYIGRVCLG